MNEITGTRDEIPLVSRRRLLIAAGGGLAAAAIGGWPGRPAGAARPAARFVALTRTIEVDGKPAPMLGFGLPDGARVARFTAGKRFAVSLENRLAEPTLIHWHGLTPPSAQDGTPGLSQDALQPGASFDYDFPLTRAGTFWMHSHLGLQKQKLLTAPLIVEDPADARRDEQEVVLILNDFTFRDPAEILAELTGGMAMHGMDHMSMDHAGHDMSHMGHMEQGAAGHAHAAMPHGDGAMVGGEHGMMTDLNDVAFDAYLANERTLADPEVVRVEPGGRVRLRVINGAASTNFWLDLGEIEGELIAVDGDPVEPVRGKRFELAMAQRLDLRLSLPKGEGAYPILALREGEAERTGIVLATKAARIATLAAAGEEKTPALAYALEQRLRAAHPLAPRAADRVIDLDLTGAMMVYDWGFDGLGGGEARPLMVQAGQRVEIVMHNRTDMSHPMHLHGHHFQVVAVDGRRYPGAVRDTVLVPRSASVTIAFDADNPGKWAFHCHNLYHMASGMMTSLHYEA